MSTNKRRHAFQLDILLLDLMKGSNVLNQFDMYFYDIIFYV